MGLKKNVLSENQAAITLPTYQTVKEKKLRLTPEILQMQENNFLERKGEEDIKVIKRKAHRKTTWYLS